MHGGLLQMVNRPKDCVLYYHLDGIGRGAGSERAGVSRSQGVLVHKAQREGDGR